MAGALATLGVQAGDRVHLHTANCPEFFDTWFATALLGAVLLPSGPQSTTEELRYVLEQATPAVSLVAPGLREPVSAAARLARSDGSTAPRVVALHGDGADALPALAQRAEPVPVPPAGGPAPGSGAPDTRTASRM